MAAVHLVDAVRHQDQDPSVARLARKVLDQLEARGVGPMQIFEHEQYRGFA